MIDQDTTAAAALRSSEIRYRRLFETAQDGILILNADSAQIDDANPYLIAMLGYSHADLLGKKLWDVGAFADSARSHEMFEALQARGYVRYDDLPLRTRQGELINVEFVSNRYDCDGVQVIQCNIRNMTEQRRAEERVHQLSLVVEQSPVGIVISDLGGRIDYINEARLRSSGGSRAALLGGPLAQLQAPGVGDDSASATLARGDTWKGEFSGWRPDGSAYTEAAIVAPIRGADGQVSHHLTLTEDITQRKLDSLELERHRHQLEDLVAVRTRELASATRKAEAANVAKSAFLANMSHEIRTPLGAITGMVHLLRRSPVTPQQAHWLDLLESAGQHLLELVTAVLDMSKIEAGKLTLDDSELDLAGVAANVAAMLSAPAAAKQLRLVVETGGLPQRLRGDAARLQQALLNYVGNAIKFTETGQITLRVLPVAAPMRPTLLGPACAASAPHGHASAPTSASDPGSVLIRFEVQDSGVGIAADVLPRLFTAFEQADNSTTRRHGGTGLGLTIVRQLALLMGGETGVISTPGRGSTFWFTARLQRAPRPAVVAAARIGTAEMRLARDHAGARVLLVDDEPMVRIVTRELLRCVFTHVDMAHDGRQALRLAGLHAYDLILMDVQMPGMDGLAATRLIRTLPGGRYVPILGVTANAFAEDMAACRGAGMDGFLAKPYAAEQLFDTMLQALLGPEHGGAATTPASAAGLFSVHSATPPPGVPAGRSAGA